MMFLCEYRAPAELSPLNRMTCLLKCVSSSDLQFENSHNAAAKVKPRLLFWQTALRGKAFRIYSILTDFHQQPPLLKATPVILRRFGNTSIEGKKSLKLSIVIEMVTPGQIEVAVLAAVPASRPAAAAGAAASKTFVLLVLEQEVMRRRRNNSIVPSG